MHQARYIDKHYASAASEGEEKLRWFIFRRTPNARRIASQIKMFTNHVINGYICFGSVLKQITLHQHYADGLLKRKAAECANFETYANPSNCDLCASLSDIICDRETVLRSNSSPAKSVCGTNIESEKFSP